MTLKDDLLFIQKIAIKNDKRKTLFDDILNDIIERMKVAAENKKSNISYSFKFISEDRENIKNKIISYLINEKIDIKHYKEIDIHLYIFSW